MNLIKPLSRLENVFIKLVLPENAYLKQQCAKGCQPFDAGEHGQFDGQLNDDYSIEGVVYRKSLFSLHEKLA